MIKEGDPPVSIDLLERARRELDRSYGFALAEEDGRTALLVRVPESKPGPFHSLEVVSFGVAEDDLVGVDDVLLVGDDRIVRVEPKTLEDLVEERREEDPEVARHLRNRLERDYDYTVFRHKGARDHLRLGVRVPRERVDTLDEDDREELADALAPILDSPKGRKIRAYYLVGDAHARRLARDELVDLVGAGLEGAVEDPAPPEPEPQAEPEPAVETEPPSGAEELDAPSGGASPGTSPSPDPAPGEASDSGAEFLETGSSSDPDPEPADLEPAPEAQGAEPEPTTEAQRAEPEPTPADRRAEPDPAAEAQQPGSPAGSGPAPPDGGPAEETGPGTDDAPGTGQETPPDDASGPDAAEAREPASGGGGGATRPSPDDEGVAGLAGRAGQVDREEGRPEPDEADPEPEPAPTEAEPATTPEPPAEGGDGGSVAPGAPGEPGETSSGPAETGPEPASAAAARLREAGYEVVEGVEAAGRTFDFAADRSGGKRLLGLAVPRLTADDVAALAEAGREAGADAVLAVPDDVAPGAREAAWGTAVDVLPPSAAAGLEL